MNVNEKIKIDDFFIKNTILNLHCSYSKRATEGNHAATHLSILDDAFSEITDRHTYPNSFSKFFQWYDVQAVQIRFRIMILTSFQLEFGCNSTERRFQSYIFSRSSWQLHTGVEITWQSKYCQYVKESNSTIGEPPY
jgi:hypothetical protein